MLPSHPRRSVVRFTLSLIACSAVVLGGSTAAHAVTSDLSWALDQSTNTYPTQYSISSTGTGVDYRWRDQLTKTTVISANSCGDLSLFGSSTYGPGDTDYHRLTPGPQGLCFYVRGRVAAGQGSTTTRTGRVQR